MKQLIIAVFSFCILLFVTFPSYTYSTGLFSQKKLSNVIYFSSPQFNKLVHEIRVYVTDKQIKFYHINQELRFSLFANSHNELNQLKETTLQFVNSKIESSVQIFNESLNIANTEENVSRETQIILNAIKKSKLSTTAQKITSQDAYYAFKETPANFRQLNFNVFVAILISLILSLCLFFLLQPSKEND